MTSDLKFKSSSKFTIGDNGNQYKVFAQALHKEKINEIPKQRRSNLYNIIIFIIYDVKLSEEVLQEAAQEYLDEEANKNTVYYVIYIVCVNAGMGVIMVVIIQMKLIRPIDKLSKMMTSKQNEGKMKKYVSKIKMQAEKQG